MTRRKIKEAAVLGAGVMGSRIAALLAGVGIQTYLLDIVPTALDEKDMKKGLTETSPAFRNKLAIAGIQGTIGNSPPAIFAAEDAKLVKPGNFEDHLGWISDADWIIEVVAERLDIKRELLKRVAAHRKPGAIVSTNTSGLSIEAISGDLSEEFRAHFLGTHFFNPPRHMRLLEIIPGKSTNGDVVRFMARFCEQELGKNIVFAKDTPNFIANRIGIYGIGAVMKAMIDQGLTIEEVDAITGIPMARPKSATFRTADMVGLDTVAHVAKNMYDRVQDPAEKVFFALPPFLQTLVETGRLGETTGQGFYKKMMGPRGSEILTLDYNTLDYVPRREPNLPGMKDLEKVEDPAARIETLVYADNRVGRFAWELVRGMLLYTASKIPEIADDVLSVDRAMKWGYNWDMGPFEIWDAIGVKRSVERMEKEGEKIPETVTAMLRSGKERFYQELGGKQYFFDLIKSDYAPIEAQPQVILLPLLKKAGGIVRASEEASLIDMGDGVALLEFHSANNALGEDAIRMISWSVREVEANFEGLVIGNQGAHFCVGADLKRIYPLAVAGKWDLLDQAVRAFQQANLDIKYCACPVVAAPFRMTLGGGAEVCMAASQVRAHAECYMGLVEMGVGLIPAGGGCKEMVLRATDWVPDRVPSGFPGGSLTDLASYVARAFETIALAKVSTSAQEAKDLTYMRPQDGITMNLDHLLQDAKETVMALAKAGYRPPRPRGDIRVIGRTGRAVLEFLAYALREGAFISEHDQLMARKLANVVSGGDLDQNSEVTEQYLLDLEREAFLSLCGEPKSQERMKYMIDTNKPLRN
jgi:3-hydroxyacyl-CoA dehydrogenase